MSKAYRSLNQPAKAIAAIKKAIKTSKNPFKLDKQHLLLLKETGEATEIIDKSAELIHKYPGDPKLYADYAKILLDNDQLYEAAEASRNALRIEHPGLSAEDKAELHYIIGKHLHHEGHLDQAIHHLGESIKIDSNNSTPLVEMGLVYKARREPDLAIKKMQEAIEINKNDPWAYLEAGILFKDNNDYIQAEKMFRRAADLSPEDTNITRMLAAVVVLNLVHNQKIEKEQID